MSEPGERLLRRGDYVWGSWVKPESLDGYILGVNPGDRSDSIGRYAFALSSVDDAVGSAKAGFATWSRATVEQRHGVAERFAALLESQSDELARLITREVGKPLWEAQEEVHASIRTARMLQADGPLLLERRTLRDRTAWSDFKPHGVVAVITPYGMPLLVPTLHVLAAMLAGNTVVFKPSKFSPGVGQAVAELFDRCRLPRGAFNMVQGSGATVGQRLATHPDTDALLFSGSHESASVIREQLAHRPELPALFQCGGKAAAIVLDDGDIPRAAYDLVVSAHITAGQRPNNCARVFVARERFDEFCVQVGDLTRGLKIGYGFDEDVFMGPLISDTLRDHHRRYVRRLSDAGHECLVDGGNVPVEGRRGFYTRPSVFWVENGEGLDAEPPGPVMQIHPVEDWTHAVGLHNQLSYRGAVALYTPPDGAAADALMAALRTGAIHMNHGTIGTTPRLPAAGQGRASNGIASDVELLRFLSVPRATLVDHRATEERSRLPGTPEPGSALVGAGG